MEILQTKKASEWPTKLDMLEIVIRRSFQPDSNDVSELTRLRRGVEGEEIVLDYLEQYGRRHWKVIRNIWLDYYGVFESDFILFTRNSIQLLEVKNYNGIFQYRDGISKLNHREISGNAVYQTRRALKNIRELAQQKYLGANVQGALVFVGADNPVEISPSIEDIQIIQRNQLREFIKKICYEEDLNSFSIIDSEKIVSHFEQFRTPNPFQAESVSDEKMKQLRKGILCAECANPNVTVTKKFVKCICNHVELREEAMVRTICEYGVLNYQNHLTIKSLFDFFDGQTSRRYLNRILSTHFTVIIKGKYTYYINPKLPFHKIKHIFNWS